MNEHKFDATQETNMLSVEIAKILCSDKELSQLSDKQVQERIMEFLDKYLIAKTIIDNHYDKQLCAVRDRVQELVPKENAQVVEAHELLSPR